MSDGTSEPGGAQTGSQSGSAKTYTEAELQEHVGRAQSPLAKQLAAISKERDEAVKRADVAEAENGEFKAKAKEGPTSVALLAREKEIAAREKSYADRVATDERAALIIELGVKAEDVAAYTNAELRGAKLAKLIQPATSTVRMNRGSGSAPGGPLSAQDMIARAMTRKE